MIRWLPLVLLVGCVPKKKFVELDESYMDAMAMLEERDGTVDELAEERAALRSRVKSLKAEVARLEAALGERETEVATLTADKAALVKDRSSLRASVEEMEAALAELMERRAAAEARIAEYKDLLSRFESLIDSGALRVKIVDGRMVVELATDILFDSGRAALSEEGQTALLEVAGVLAELDDRAFQVEGHTDDVPISTDRFPSNWELASARAITVVRTLKEGGVAKEQLSAASYADLRPVADNDTEEGRAANRRIEIVLVPDLSDLPGFDELEALQQGSAEEPEAAD